MSRHAYEGADVMRRYGSRLPRVIHVSLGTNDDPGDVAGFRDAIADVMKVAGQGAAAWSGRTSCAALPGRELPRLQPRAGGRVERRDNLRVLNWVRMVRAHPEWLARDGVHVSAAGYRARAKAVARMPCAAASDAHAALRDADLERRGRRARR